MAVVRRELWLHRPGHRSCRGRRNSSVDHRTACFTAPLNMAGACCRTVAEDDAPGLDRHRRNEVPAACTSAHRSHLPPKQRRLTFALFALAILARRNWVNAKEEVNTKPTQRAGGRARGLGEVPTPSRRHRDLRHKPAAAAERAAPRHTPRHTGRSRHTAQAHLPRKRSSASLQDSSSAATAAAAARGPCASATCTGSQVPPNRAARRHPAQFTLELHAMRLSAATRLAEEGPALRIQRGAEHRPSPVVCRSLDRPEPAQRPPTLSPEGCGCPPPASLAPVLCALAIAGQRHACTTVGARTAPKQRHTIPDCLPPRQPLPRRWEWALPVPQRAAVQRCRRCVITRRRRRRCCPSKLAQKSLLLKPWVRRWLGGAAPHATAGQGRTHFRRHARWLTSRRCLPAGWRHARAQPQRSVGDQSRL
jgi:hypothetical protein